jgi:hypothetical protein
MATSRVVWCVHVQNGIQEAGNHFGTRAMMGLSAASSQRAEESELAGVWLYSRIGWR